MEANGSFSIISNSVGLTQSLGEELGNLLNPGQVITLDGDLGAGKTHFSQGVAKGLGVDQSVTSPTFNIVNEYTTGRIPLFHLDLYRLEDPVELEDIGFYEVTDDGSHGAALIEWAHKFSDDLPDDRLEITFTVVEDQAEEALQVLEPSNDEYVDRSEGEQGDADQRAPIRRIDVAAYGHSSIELLLAWRDSCADIAQCL